MWMFYIDYITRNNSYVQLLATLCMFLPLLHDLCQMSTECFAKPAVVYNFWGVKLLLALGLPKPYRVVRGVIKLLPFLLCIARLKKETIYDLYVPK